MAEFPYVVGDEFEGSAQEIGRYISEVSAVGGRVEFVDGKVIRLVYLPETVFAPKLNQDDEVVRVIPQELPPVVEEVLVAPIVEQEEEEDEVLLPAEVDWQDEANWPVEPPPPPKRPRGRPRVVRPEVPNA